MLTKLKRTLLTLAATLTLTSCALLSPAPSAPQAPADIPEDGSTFAVHYIDVGQADCALVACDGQYMLIDGGNAEDSSLVYAYLEQHSIDHLDYMVASHAHEDHIGGLSGALNYATVDTALSPVTEGSTKVFQNLVTQLDKQNKALTVPQAGQSFSLGSAQVELLGPQQEYDDTNNTSIVLRVDYGQTSFLFTGDMESGAETDLVESGVDLRATVLKVGHHGSDTSSSYRFLREVMPTYAVISVGEGNSYGHPSETVLSRLQDADAEIYRTDLHGTIIAESDGTTVTFRTDHTVPAEDPHPTVTSYVGNSSSQKFHFPTCSSVDDISPKNEIVFSSRSQAIADGYSPCGRCDP